MLKRSPRSKAIVAVSILLALIAAYISVDSLTTLNALAHKHGKRKIYFELNRDVSKGTKLSENDFSNHQMFSGDAPHNALSTNRSAVGLFASNDLLHGTILTANMVAKDASSTIDNGNRIIFVPTKDVLEKSYSTRTDLLSVSPEGFGVEILATGARILFDLNSDSRSQNENNNPGYFVEVSEDEASSITEALSQSDVRFALIKSGG